jgi:hypothetical protein
MYNNTFESLISKIYYNFKSVELFDSCLLGDFTKCYSKDKTSILLKSLNSKYKSEINDAKDLVLKDFN